MDYGRSHFRIIEDSNGAVPMLALKHEVLRPPPLLLDPAERIDLDFYWLCFFKRVIICGMPSSKSHLVCSSSLLQVEMAVALCLSTFCFV